MFLELPKNCQEMIYEKLHAKDRICLNMALPRQNKIYRTCKTNYKKDIKLGILHNAITKHDAKISRSVIRFLKENKDDPTVIDIRDIKGSALALDGPTYDSDSFLTKLCDKTLDRDFLNHLFATDDISFVKIGQHTASFATVQQYDMLCEYDMFNVFVLNDSMFFFNVVNFTNLALATHIMNGHNPIDADTFGQSVEIVKRHLATCKFTRQFVWDLFEFSEEDTKIVLDKLCEAMDFEGIKEFIDWKR